MVKSREYNPQPIIINRFIGTVTLAVLMQLSSGVELKQEWREKAACCNAVGLEMFPDFRDTEAVSTAKSYCERCPIIKECFAYAAANQEPCGVWGGVLFTEHLLKKINELKEPVCNLEEKELSD